MRIQLILERSDLAAASRNKGASYIQSADFRYPIMEMFFRAEYVRFIDTTGEEIVLKDKRGCDEQNNSIR